MGRRTSSLYYCGRRRRWFYALLVTGAVAVIVALPFVAEKQTVFEAKAWVTPPIGVSTRIEPNAATQLSPVWRDTLPAAVKRATGHIWSDAEVDRLTNATTIRMDHSRKGDDYVLLSVQWDAAQSAEQLVRALAEELCERKNRELPTPPRDLNDPATATRQCAEILRDESRAEVAEIKHLIAEHDKGAAAAEQSGTEEKVPAAVMVVNPVWESLHRKLEKLDAQRLKMLEVYTAQHPLMANLTAQRDDVEALLARTPQQVAGPEVVAQEKRPSDARAAAPEATVKERHRLLAQLAELERNVADAEQFVRQAVESEQRVGSVPPPPGSRWQFTKYADAEPRVGSRSAAPLGRLGLIALLAGSIVALGVVGIRPTYESAAEAFARLPVLAVGVIPAAGPVHRPTSLRTWAARLVGACEWALIAVAIFLALAVWKKPYFGQGLLADPISVLATPGDWVPWLRR
jgi:hypothetical protein